MKAILLNSALIKMIQESTSEFHPVGRFAVYSFLTLILACAFILAFFVIRDGAPNF